MLYFESVGCLLFLVLPGMDFRLTDYEVNLYRICIQLFVRKFWVRIGTELVGDGPKHITHASGALL